MMQFLKSILFLRKENEDLKKRISEIETKLKEYKKIHDEHLNYTTQLSLGMVDLSQELDNFFYNLNLNLNKSNKKDKNTIFNIDDKYLN
jgi:cell division septum initiation protein DivIVA